MNQHSVKTEEQKDNDNYAKNFTRVPNILFESYKYLTKEEVLLYIRLRYIYWDTKPRYLSLRELADITGYSTGALSKMLPRLTIVGLIHAEIRRKKGKDGKEKGNPIYHITINDIWEENRKFFTEGHFDPSEALLVHEMNETSSPNEQDTPKPVHQMNKPVHKMNDPVHETRQDSSPNEQDQAQNNPHKTNSKTIDNTSTQEESVTPTIADVPACGANAPALSALPLQEKMLEEETICSKCGNLTITPNDCPWCKASKQVSLQEKGQTDGSSNNNHRHLSSLNSHQPLRQQLDTADDTHGATPTQQKEGLTDGHDSIHNPTHLLDHGSNLSIGTHSDRHPGKSPVAQQTSTSKPVQEVPPLATLSKVPEQAALMAPAEPKPRARSAPKKAVEKPAGPPPSEMEWSTRKCMMLFDFWRGAPLIGTYKNSQASTCAKGLAANYTEQQVVDARTDMEADIYWMSHGGVDICEVANNIHKYVRKRQLTIVEKAPVPVKIDREYLKRVKP